MLYGFKKWHSEVQPIQDEIVRLQLEKLRHEVEQLRPKTPTAHNLSQAGTSETKH